MQINFIDIRCGEFLMGAVTNEGHPLDKETPQQLVYLDDFKISETTITNSQFKAFIDDTGYITTAEKLGGSFVFYLLLDEELEKESEIVKNTEWWHYVEGANWKNPCGPNSDISEILDHPVVHISYMDAIEFCNWSNTRLPSEAEWEYAARANSTTKYPWGDKLIIDGKYQANIWQGNFPFTNSMDDGFLGTAPVKSYKPNNWGLYQVIGNVWEWCINPRYINLEDFNKYDYKAESKIDLSKINKDMEFATRGGSFLCHDSYCNRYRLGARNGNYADSTTSNCGFRVCK